MLHGSGVRVARSRAQACRQPIHNPFTSLFTRPFTTLTTFLGRRRLESVTRESQFKASESAPFRVARRLANRLQTGCKRVAYTCRRPASSDAPELAFSAMIQALPCAAFFTEGLPALAFLVSSHISFRSMARRGTAAPCSISWHEPTHTHARSLILFFPCQFRFGISYLALLTSAHARR
jgi:hypothetical protein